jgi:DNA-binding transcriptional regulator YhcF (GntR family)
MPRAPGRVGPLRVDDGSGVPKYRQLVDSVCRSVRDGELERGDRLPSINTLCHSNGLSRDTVVKAYNRLKEMGVIASSHGKSFTIATDHITSAVKVFAIFDSLTPYKETLYEAMRGEAAGRLDLDLYFHHFRPAFFEKALGDAAGAYSHYIVMPFPDPAVRRALADVDQDRLVVIDIDVDFPGQRCATVLQSHDRELVAALEQAAGRIAQYRSLTLVFPKDKHHPPVIRAAFQRFCRAHGVRPRIVEELDERAIEAGNAYFVIEDTDLVAFIKSARNRRLRIGRDVGVLSYNDTPMKEVTDPGTSVVSIDFAELGRRVVRQILDWRNPRHVWEPTRFISRGSL